MKVTAKAPANIAFIKYWGKKDKKLRIPMNNSISMNLSDVFTTTSVEFKSNLKKDKITIDNKKVSGRERERVVTHLDRIRKKAGIGSKAIIESKNNFPRGTGIASSASGFAALTLAATKAAGLDLKEKELSALARLASGSAARSISDGFVEWKKGGDDKTSFAYSLHPSDYWDIRDVVVVVEKKKKKISSTSGHSLVDTSPFFRKRIEGMKGKVEEIKKAIKNRKFTKFGEIVESEAINMHAVMLTSDPPIYYWMPKTLEIMLAVRDWREKGLESCFTLDAGPNVHLICLSKNKDRLLKKLKKITGINNIIVNKPSIGARILRD